MGKQRFSFDGKNVDMEQFVQESMGTYFFLCAALLFRYDKPMKETRAAGRLPARRASKTASTAGVRQRTRTSEKAATKTGQNRQVFWKTEQNL